jgi:membrane-bound lytic murein transglycosylase D
MGRRGAARRLQGARLLLVLIPVCIASAARAEEFPTPPEVASVARFWVEIFTSYSLDDAVIHDPGDPRRVYEVVHGVRSAPDMLAARVQACADRLALARAVGLPGLGALLAPPSEPPRVRVQRGMRETVAWGLVAMRLYLPMVEEALAREDLPPELAVLPLVESSYHPGAVSHAGAVGLWQFTRGTGRRYLRVGGGIDERRDPVRASEAAARYLRELRDGLPNWPLAITAYNHGPAGVEQARRAVGSDDIVALVTRWRGPGFGFASRTFYAQFLAALQVVRQQNRYFPKLAPARMVEYRVKPGDTLARVARRHGVSLATIRAGNGLHSAALQPGQRLLIRL